MCGITGIVNLNQAPVAQDVLASMTKMLAHRGPDDEDLFLDNHLGFGHRRLSVIDPGPAGRQPMTTPDGRFTLSYNGEIYNYLDIRNTLEAKGINFLTNTDTEVVLHSLAVWGTDALLKFNGMFALSFWDRADQSLLLARDRYGIKPLYYSQQKQTFLFGSEIKSMLPHPDFKSEMDLEALLEYMTFQNFFTSKTLFSNVEILPAGCFMKIQANNVQTPERYWDYHFTESSEDRTEESYVEELEHLFTQAVKRQLISDVPISSYLSGGLDSGSITAVASSEVQPLRTFTVGFDLHSASGLEMAYDERERSEYLSYLFQTEHYEMVLKAGDMERCLKKMVWHLEEPRVGQSYPNYYAAQLASKFAKVVLGGTGGDELFGGYPWRYYRAVINDDFYEYATKYYKYWQRLIPNRHIQKAFAPVWDDVSHIRTLDIFANILKEHAQKGVQTPEEYVNHSLYLEAKTFLHGLFVVEDKLAMAHGIESRVPFMDNDLVDFAMKLPVRHKLGNLGEVVRLNENEPGPKLKKYFSKTQDGKLILRKMNVGIPKDISTAVKQGFSAPDNSWFKGESIDYVRERILEKNALIYNYMDAEPLTQMINEHLDGHENRRLLIWSLLYLEEFCETFMTTKH